MNRSYYCEIRVKEHLDRRWSDWFDGLEFRHDAGGVTMLSGYIVDQTALFGVLTQIHSLNLTLLSMNVAHTQESVRRLSQRLSPSPPI